jgi:hypothetical protein
MTRELRVGTVPDRERPAKFVVNGRFHEAPGRALPAPMPATASISRSR